MSVIDQAADVAAAYELGADVEKEGVIEVLETIRIEIPDNDYEIGWNDAIERAMEYILPVPLEEDEKGA